MASTGSSSSVPPGEASGSADVLVGVPTYNHAATIELVVTAVGTALAGFPDLRSRIVIADVGSQDATVARARAADPTGSLSVISVPLPDPLVPYHGVPGRARAVRAIFETAVAAGARAVALVDASVSSVTPAWVERLLRPVLTDGVDFVAAHYRRHPYDGALTKSIVHPVFRACFGVRLHQPMAADVGCSRRLVDWALDPVRWPEERSKTDIDLWLAATAATERFTLCEAAVGVRVRDPREDASDLGTTVAYVVGALFTELERRAELWHRVRTSRSLPLVGTFPDGVLDPPAVSVPRLIESFRLGYRELGELWAEVLPPATILDLKRLAAQPEETFRLDDRLWARIVYEFAVGYRLRTVARDHLLRALVPLYLAWLASFVLEVRDAPERQVDERLERVDLAFETEKPYLISRWRWPERFQPPKRGA